MIVKKKGSVVVKECSRSFYFFRAAGSSLGMGRLIDQRGEGSDIEARSVDLPLGARKRIFFAFIFSYHDGLWWHFRTLKSRKRRFQVICSHRPLAETIASPPTSSRSGKQRQEGWCALSPSVGTGSRDEYITINQEYKFNLK